MFKIAINTPERYLAIKKVPVLRSFFAPRLTSFAELDPALFTAYISVIRGAGGVYMSTLEDRFSELDDTTLGYLGEREHNCIHDVGVSSGVTTLNWYNTLKASGRPFQLALSEKYNRFFKTGRILTRVYSRDELVEGYCFGLLASGSVSWLFPISRVLFAVMKRAKRKGPEVSISMYDPRIRDLLKKGLIQEVDVDIFSSQVADTYSYVRCMNLLNLGYFGPDQLRSAIKGLMASLIEGGILQVGRTDLRTGRNSVTFFRKVKDGMTVDQSFNGGTEIMSCLDDLIVQGTVP